MNKIRLTKSAWLFLTSILFFGILPFQQCAQSPMFSSNASQNQTPTGFLNPISDLPGSTIISQPGQGPTASGNNGIPYFGKIVYQSTDTACAQSGVAFSQIDFESPTRALLVKDACVDLPTPILLDPTSYLFDFVDPTLLTYNGHSYHRTYTAPPGSSITTNKVFYRIGETVQVDWVRPGVISGHVQMTHVATGITFFGAWVRPGNSGSVTFPIPNVPPGIWDAVFSEASGGVLVKSMEVALSIEP